ncbi:MAG: PAS domain S-box protein [Gemmatimonadetes bacterium]|nr:PAS domain S-box protein [Gemmatimonadota bacterium]
MATSGPPIEQDPGGQLPIFNRELADAGPQAPQADVFREVFEHGLGLICTHTLDGMLLSINPAAAGALGYEPGELINQPLERLVASAARDLVPSYLQRIRKHGSDSGIWRVVTRDGEERLWLYRNAVVAMPNAEPFVVGHAQDVTELREAVQEEREAAVNYRALVEHAGYGIYRATVDGSLLMVNPALVTMLGYTSSAALLNVNLEQVYAEPATRARLIADYQHADRIDDLETVWKRKDGTEITVSLTGRPVRDSAGEVECFEMFVKDVSEQRALEDQLKQAQKMELVGQLTGGMAHDFNNLLTVILANANLIGSALPAGDGSMRDDLDELEAAALRGTAMVKRLLGFSRRVHFPRQPLDIAQLTTDLMGTLKRLLPETIEIRLSSSPALPQVQADPSAVEQIIVNLATNARDAMPNGGILRFDTRRARLDEAHRITYGWGDPGDYVCVSASDTGIGMTKEVIAKIFEPFFTTKEPGHGTGLGMPMIYGLMKQHRGFVDVSSEPGKGTTVQLFFPATAVKGPVPASPESIPQLEGGTETILLVEDEEPIRRAAKRVLERFGYKVLLAPDGAEGLEVFHEKGDEVGLIVSDVMMPRMNGGEFYRAVRQERPSTKFLFMSGYNSDDLSGTVVMEEDVPFMRKPWTPTEFLGRVREVLDNGASKSFL